MKEFLTAAEVAEWLQIPVNRIYELTSEFEASGGQKGLPFVRLGEKQLRFSRPVLQRFLTGEVFMSADVVKMYRPDRNGQIPSAATSGDPDLIEAPAGLVRYFKMEGYLPYAEPPPPETTIEMVLHQIEHKTPEGSKSMLEVMRMKDPSVPSVRHQCGVYSASKRVSESKVNQFLREGYLPTDDSLVVLWKREYGRQPKRAMFTNEEVADKLADGWKTLDEPVEPIEAPFPVDHWERVQAGDPSFYKRGSYPVNGRGTLDQFELWQAEQRYWLSDPAKRESERMHSEAVRVLKETGSRCLFCEKQEAELAERELVKAKKQLAPFGDSKGEAASSYPRVGRTNEEAA